MSPERTECLQVPHGFGGSFNVEADFGELSRAASRRFGEKEVKPLDETGGNSLCPPELSRTRCLQSFHMG